MSTTLNVAIIGEYKRGFVPHAATNGALHHAAAALGIGVDIRWVPTEPLERDLTPIRRADALWCAPGSPYRSMFGAIVALRHGREHGVPTLGTCGGCQHIVIEYARHVLGFDDAQHAEYDPYASRLFVAELTCSLAGQIMQVALTPGSRVADLYGRTQVREEYYCNFGLNPRFQQDLVEAGLRVTGSDASGEARVVEVPEHPFYLGVLFVPQTRSTPERPHPLVLALLRAALDRTGAGMADARAS